MTISNWSAQQKADWAKKTAFKEAIYQLYRSNKITTNDYKQMSEAEQTKVQMKVNSLQNKWLEKKSNFQETWMPNNVEKPREIRQSDYKKDWYGTLFYINDKISARKKREPFASKEKRQKLAELNPEKTYNPFDEQRKTISENRQNRLLKNNNNRKGLNGRSVYRPSKEVKRQSFFQLPKIGKIF